MPLLYTDPRFLLHETGRHPESPERLRHLHQRLADSELTAQFERPDCVAAPIEQLLPVHERGYIEQIRTAAQHGGGQVEADTVMSAQSFDVALLAAGTAADAVDRVIAGEHRQAVCLVRPPGHHALQQKPMGFCLFNNVAVAAFRARQKHGLDRVLIVDWDVHHGNGTQDTFYADPNVWFLSVHRSPFYPGTGDADETGTGAGLGTTFNLPLPLGTSRREYFARFESLLQKAAAKCRPQLVLVSAGYDAHKADPIGKLGLETEDYAKLTALCLGVAGEYAGGRMVSLLEGGYNVPILADCVLQHLAAITRPNR